MQIPFKTLSPDALKGIVEEYVTREGTEYGAHEFSLEQKVQQVMQQLESGDVIVEYDQDLQTCNLLKRDGFS